MYDDTPQRRYRTRHLATEQHIENAHMGNIGGDEFDVPTVEDEMEEQGTVEETESRESCVHKYSVKACDETVENA